MKCPACQIGAIRECFMLNGKRCAENRQEIVKGKIVSDPSLDKAKDLKTGEIRRGPFHKQDEEVRDAKSTGRKRAAIILPLISEDGTPVVCEWAGLKFAGGGRDPIVGCTGNRATNRHHGPDKNTLNNSRENPRNIHLICPHCHNRWHAHNNPRYDEYVKSLGGPQNLPAHDMETRATTEELVANELRYQKAGR